MGRAARTLILIAALMALTACSGSGENKPVSVVNGVPLGGIGW